MLIVYVNIKYKASVSASVCYPRCYIRIIILSTSYSGSWLVSNKANDANVCSVIKAFLIDSVNDESSWVSS